MAAPRIIIVTRQAVIESLQARYGTISNAAYSLSVSDSYLDGGGAAAAIAEASAGTRQAKLTYEQGARNVRRAGASRSVSTSNKTYDQIRSSSSRINAAIRTVQSIIPNDWRRVSIRRDDLANFLFEPDDIVVCVGQDGLVANAAKYLTFNQPVIGINPEPGVNPGVLVPWQSAEFEEAFEYAIHKEYTDPRGMVEAVCDNGQTLVCLNEVFIGHRSHQSARYYIEANHLTERQSSSGVICFTGTGATGWASSCYQTYSSHPPDMPSPQDKYLGFFVREPWQAGMYGATIRAGVISAGTEFMIRSEMEEGGVVFGDGIELDYMELSYGRVVVVKPSAQQLNLVIPSAARTVKTDDKFRNILAAARELSTRNQQRAG